MSQVKHHKTSDPKISSHTSLFWTLPEQLSKLQRAFLQICPELMSQVKHHKTSDPEISSHTSLFWTLPEQLSKLQRAFPQICPELMSQVKNTKPQTPRFHLTHPVLNSAGTALQVTACISANLPWTNVPRKNKMKPTNPNAYTYVNGTNIKTHGYAVTHNTFLQ